jgi:PDZ domain
LQSPHSRPGSDTAPQEALPPLFITTVLPGSPAASNGLRPGDIIVSVNGAPPFPGGVISAGVMNPLFGPYPQPGRVFDAAQTARGVGVAPDYYLPLTAQDLSTGHDPDIAKALTLLGG